jgi:hypothetical protein
MILVAVAILVGVFLVATGRGGELAYEHADHAPLDLGPVSATDVALLRPPTALWGYNMQVTDEALEKIAQAVRDRDVTIAFLQQRLADQITRAVDSGAPTSPEPASPELTSPDLLASPELTSPDLLASPKPPTVAEPRPSAELPPARPGPDDHAGAEPGDGAFAEEQAW